MSVEVLAWVLKNSTASATEKLILVGIAMHADKDGRNSWPTTEMLATYAGTSVRTIQRLLPKLAAEGCVIIRRNSGGDAHRRSDRRPNLYEVVMHGVTSSCHPVDADGVTPVVTPERGPRGDKKAPSKPDGVTKSGPRGDRPVLKNEHIGPLESPLKSNPSVAASVDAPSEELFALADEPGPGNPVQTLVGAYADAIKSAGGIPTKRRLQATGKNIKRLISEDRIPLPILLVAVQRAGTAKSLDIDRFLGDVQQTYERGGKSRRSLIDSWAAKYGPQPAQNQIGA